MGNFARQLDLNLALYAAALFLLCMPAAAFAQSYTPLEPLPFLSQATNVSLPALLQALFQLLIVGGAGVATLMLTIGGIQYMTGEAIHQKSEGRARIQNALFGLVLLLFIYVLLQTINPQLLNFNLSSIEMVGGNTNEFKQKQQAQQQTQLQRDTTAADPGPAAAPPSPSTPRGAPAPSSVLPGDYGDSYGGFTGGIVPTNPAATAATPENIEAAMFGADPVPTTPTPSNQFLPQAGGPPSGPIYSFAYSTPSGQTSTRFTTDAGTCASQSRSISTYSSMTGMKITTLCTAQSGAY